MPDPHSHHALTVAVCREDHVANRERFHGFLLYLATKLAADDYAVAVGKLHAAFDNAFAASPGGQAALTA